MRRFVIFLFHLVAIPTFAQKAPQLDSLPGYMIEDTSRYTYEMIVADLDTFLASYPDIVHPVAIGRSEFGLELKTVRIGRNKPCGTSVFLVGNIHAREHYSSKLLMKFLNGWLLSISGVSNAYPDAASLLDSVDIYIMPVANPDGMKIAQYNFDGILDSVNFYLDRDSIFCVEGFPEWKANGKGIDLNRTFDDGNWDVKSGDGFQPRPASEGYKGEFPAQPLETRAIQGFVNQIKPLITASFHTKGEVLFWADSKTHPFFMNVDTEITKRVTAATGYKASSVAKNPASYGCGLENYVRLKLGLLGTCVELSPGTRGRTPHPDASFNSLVWNKAWQIPAIYIRSAVKYRTQIVSNSATYLQSVGSY